MNYPKNRRILYLTSVLSTFYILTLKTVVLTVLKDYKKKYLIVLILFSFVYTGPTPTR